MSTEKIPALSAITLNTPLLCKTLHIHHSKQGRLNIEVEEQTYFWLEEILKCWTLWHLILKVFTLIKKKCTLYILFRLIEQIKRDILHFPSTNYTSERTSFHIPRFVTKQAASSNWEMNILTFDHRMVAAQVPLVTATPAVKRHCQSLLCCFHGLCEIHFLCLNTFCQGRKGPMSNFLHPVLTGSIWQQMAAWLLDRWDIYQLLDCLLLFHNGSFSLHYLTLSSLLLPTLSASLDWILSQSDLRPPCA